MDRADTRAGRRDCRMEGSFSFKMEGGGLGWGRSFLSITNYKEILW